MSKRAEESAIKAYPVVIEEHTERDFNKPRRLSYIKGYEQAEKDLALTWIDIRNILSIAQEVEDENDACPLLKSELCDEVLERFNEQREKK